MERLIRKYADKLVASGLVEPGAPLLGGLDADIVWNREGDEIPVLAGVIGSLNINSILFARPGEPWFSILRHLAANTDALTPQDCETRTFLHDIPVTRSFDAGEIARSLRSRKSVIIPDRGIVTFGIVSPEQAFVTFSSVCFSAYVKFFTDYYYNRERYAADPATRALARSALEAYGAFISSFAARPALGAPFADEAAVCEAMAEAGRLTVASRMVDSFFGNISCRRGDTIFISQTGSSLDELEGYIDPCPLDGSSTAAITASSELSAHRSVYERTGYKAILHGHPKFSVIMSMICDEEGCANRGACFKSCSRQRGIDDVPFIPGEVGTGPTGISTTLPPALTGRGAIVWGHGLFTTGKEDFTDAFEHLIGIEKRCFEAYCERVL